jgi:phosphoglycerate dehydrogenase-like enzyme
MHKVHILSAKKETYQSLIEKAHLPDLTIEPNPAPDVDILLGDPTLLKGALASFPALAWVQSIWAGVEPLLDPSLRRDYILTNARGVFGGLMSEYVFAYLLAHERKILHLHQLQQQRHWDNSNLGTLRGKTIGLLGVGSIGAEVARAAKFFGMNVRGYTRSSGTCPHVDEFFHGDDLLKFANKLDYLVNILPNTPHTRKLINAKLLNALPAHAVFINVGRGAVVDEPALIDALSQNKLAAAVLDVFEQEPLPPDHPFWATPNLSMTFHTAAPSIPEDIAKLFIENYYLFHQDKPLKYQVNFDQGY